MHAFVVPFIQKDAHYEPPFYKRQAYRTAENSTISVDHLRPSPRWAKAIRCRTSHPRIHHAKGRMQGIFIRCIIRLVTLYRVGVRVPAGFDAHGMSPGMRHDKRSASHKKKQIHGIMIRNIPDKTESDESRLM
jgi:hypothetical protein